MDKNIKPLTDFLVELGIEKVGHTNSTYLAHLIGLYRLMASLGCSEELCRAGMFHSIYGTQRFQGFTLPLERRSEIRGLIGERAERLAYLNCAVYRPTLDQAAQQKQGPYRIKDRITGQDVELTPADFDDLVRIHLFDWLEQVPRSKEWDLRRRAFRAMATRLGGVALEAYDRVFAAEAAG